MGTKMSFWGFSTHFKYFSLIVDYQEEWSTDTVFCMCSDRGDSVPKESERKWQEAFGDSRQHRLGIPDMGTERTARPEDARRRNSCVSRPRERDAGTQPGICLEIFALSASDPPCVLRKQTNCRSINHTQN